MASLLHRTIQQFIFGLNIRKLKNVIKWTLKRPLTLLFFKRNIFLNTQMTSKKSIFCPLLLTLCFYFNLSPHIIISSYGRMVKSVVTKCSFLQVMGSIPGRHRLFFYFFKCFYGILIFSIWLRFYHLVRPIFCII